MFNSKEKEEMFKYNFPLADVQDFLAGYQNSMSKDNWLKNYATEESNNPSIIDKIKASVVSVLKKYGLGYRVGAGGGREKSQAALQESIKYLSFCWKIGCAK